MNLGWWWRSTPNEAVRYAIGIISKLLPEVQDQANAWLKSLAAGNDLETSTEEIFDKSFADMSVDWLS